MKHIKLFEAFNDEDAQQAAEMNLEEIITKVFPGQTYNTSDNNKPGDYTLDNDEDGDGTKVVFSEIYLTPKQYSEVEAEIDEDYDAYIEKLQSASDEGAEIYNVGTMPEYNAISISIAFQEGHSGKR